MLAEHYYNVRVQYTTVYKLQTPTLICLVAYVLASQLAIKARGLGPSKTSSFNCELRRVGPLGLS